MTIYDWNGNEFLGPAKIIDGEGVSHTDVKWIDTETGEMEKLILVNDKPKYDQYGEVYTKIVKAPLPINVEFL